MATAIVVIFFILVFLYFFINSFLICDVGGTERSLQMDKQTIFILCIVLLTIGIGHIAEMYLKKDIVTKIELAWVGIFAVYVIAVNVMSLF